MHLSARKNKEQKERKEEQNQKKNQPTTMREQEVLKFFSSCSALLPYITEAVRAAREPDGNDANAVSLVSSFLQVQEEVGQRLMQSIR